MRSKANIKSHPLHPILVAFPIAFLTGSLLFDILAVANGNDSFFTTAGYLNIAGVVSGLIAGIPGFIDLMYTVPPDSTAKKRGIKHALTNVCNLLIFFGVWLYRTQHDAPSTYIILSVEVVGMVLLLVAGWMGGTLVYRNQIGVDPRYASAGKWKELYAKDTGNKIEVATADELQLNQMKLVHVANKRIVLGKTEDGYKAFDDHCSHRGGSLAGGAMICGTVQCPWHGSQFDVHTGAVTAGPAKDAIATYPVTEENGKVYITYH